MAPRPRKTGRALLEQEIAGQRRMVREHRKNVVEWERRSTRSDGTVVPNHMLANAREMLAGEEAFLAKLVARRAEMPDDRPTRPVA